MPRPRRRSLGRRAALLQVGFLALVATWPLWGVVSASPSTAPILLDAAGEPLPLSTYEAVVDFLRTAVVISIEDLDLATRTRPRKALLERDGIRLHAIFHDVDQYEERVALGDTVVRGFRDSYRNQLAAYAVGRLLELDEIPPSAPRRIGDRDGALTLWIENSSTWTNWHLNRQDDRSEPASWSLQRADMTVFDALIGNLDRHDSNILVDSAAHLWLIDHTRAFPRQGPRLEAGAVERCSRALWDRLHGLDPKRLRGAVEPYLDRSEIGALERRLRRLKRLFESRIEQQGEAAVLFDRP